MPPDSTLKQDEHVRDTERDTSFKSGQIFNQSPVPSWPTTGGGSGGSMTDMVRIFNRRNDDRKVLDGVDSAIETKVGVLVEFEYSHEMYGRQNHFEGYDLVGFGR